MRSIDCYLDESGIVEIIFSAEFHLDKPGKPGSPERLFLHFLPGKIMDRFFFIRDEKSVALTFGGPDLENQK